MWANPRAAAPWKELDITKPETLALMTPEQLKSNNLEGAIVAFYDTAGNYIQLKDEYGTPIRWPYEPTYADMKRAIQAERKTEIAQMETSHRRTYGSRSHSPPRLTAVASHKINSNVDRVFGEALLAAEKNRKQIQATIATYCSYYFQTTHGFMRIPSFWGGSQTRRHKRRAKKTRRYHAKVLSRKE
jgi:hypothetical protein